ncbi:hypothetical protein VCHENC01_3491 [Vibrio harveyi]|nr:hypothetical protein VCHENC01_3491 [Vibrio harveyi]
MAALETPENAIATASEATFVILFMMLLTFECLDLLVIATFNKQKTNIKTTFAQWYD